MAVALMACLVFGQVLGTGFAADTLELNTTALGFAGCYNNRPTWFQSFNLSETFSISKVVGVFSSNTIYHPELAPDYVWAEAYNSTGTLCFTSSNTELINNSIYQPYDLVANYSTACVWDAAPEANFIYIHFNNGQYTAGLSCFGQGDHYPWGHMIGCDPVFGCAFDYPNGDLYLEIWSSPPSIPTGNFIGLQVPFIQALAGLAVMLAAFFGMMAWTHGEDGFGKINDAFEKFWDRF